MLEARNVTKAYNDTPALRGVSLAAEAGEIVCLLGPSGCGKTTLLRVIAGLERADAGDVYVDCQPINDVPIHQRGFGLMFQDYALFPHRNVADNIAFGLRMRDERPAQIAARVAEMLRLVGLQGYEQRRVYELSGGERQRVALARSLAPAPRLLMLDEPLGALDRALRERLLDELRDILKRVGVTSIYVTHDQNEAFAIADRLVLMNGGMVEQAGPPEAVYQHPATLFAARFLGFSNLVPGTVRATNHSMIALDTALGPFHISDALVRPAPGAQVTVVIRPESAAIVPPEAPVGENQISGTIVERSFRGSRTRVTVQHTSGTLLTFELDGANALAGETRLSIAEAAMSLIVAP